MVASAEVTGKSASRTIASANNHLFISDAMKSSAGQTMSSANETMSSADGLGMSAGSTMLPAAETILSAGSMMVPAGESGLLKTVIIYLPATKHSCRLCRGFPRHSRVPVEE
jgi:hypothetical protein